MFQKLQVLSELFAVLVQINKYNGDEKTRTCLSRKCKIIHIATETSLGQAMGQRVKSEGGRTFLKHNFIRQSLVGFQM